MYKPKHHFVSRALCQIQLYILSNIGHSNCSRNNDLYFMCCICVWYVHIIRTLHTNLSTCYICVQLYANVTYLRCHVLYMRTVVHTRNICYVCAQLYTYVTHVLHMRTVVHIRNICYVCAQLYTYVTLLLRTRMCDMCLLTKRSN